MVANELRYSRLDEDWADLTLIELFRYLKPCAGVSHRLESGDLRNDSSSSKKYRVWIECWNFWKKEKRKRKFKLIVTAWIQHMYLQRIDIGQAVLFKWPRFERISVGLCCYRKEHHSWNRYPSRRQRSKRIGKMALSHFIVLTVFSASAVWSAPFFSVENFNSALTDVYDLYNSTAELINDIKFDNTDFAIFFKSKSNGVTQSDGF